MELASVVFDEDGVELGHSGHGSAFEQRLAAQPPLELLRSQPQWRSGGSNAVVRAEVPDGAADTVSAATRVTVLPSSMERLAMARAGCIEASEALDAVDVELYEGDDDEGDDDDDDGEDDDDNLKTSEVREVEWGGGAGGRREEGGFF